MRLAKIFQVLLVAALPFLIAATLAPPTIAPTANEIPLALQKLQNLIARDQKILEFPMNRIRTRETRLKLKAGLLELEFIIDVLEKSEGGEHAGSAATLRAVLAEEKKESEIPRTAQRYRRNLKNSVKKNLAVKQQVLSKIKTSK